MVKKSPYRAGTLQMPFQIHSDRCARSFFFKDLAPPIWLVRAYMSIKLSKLQNIHIKKHGKRLFNTAIITGFNMILLFLLHFSSKKGFLLNITCQYLNDKSTLYVHLEHFCPICLKILWNFQPSMFIRATCSFGSWEYKHPLSPPVSEGPHWPTTTKMVT